MKRILLYHPESESYFETISFQDSVQALQEGCEDVTGLTFHEKLFRKQAMPIKKPAAKSNKPKAVRIGSLNLPVGGAKPLFVGDAERAKVEDFFDGAFNSKKTSTHYSEPFTILGGETSHYKDKETVVFLIDTGEGENVYVYMGGNDTRNALAQHFMDGGAPVEMVRFHRIDVGQAQPFVAIEDAEEDESEPF